MKGKNGKTPGKLNNKKFWLSAVAILALLNAVALFVLLSKGDSRTDNAFKTSRVVYYDVATAAMLSAPTTPVVAEQTAKIDPAITPTSGTTHQEVAATAAQTPTSAAPPAHTKPAILILLLDVGISRTATENALKAPSFVSFSVSPYSAFIDKIIEDSDHNKRDYLAQIPVEPKDYPLSNPGNLALLVKNELPDNLIRMESVLEKIPNAKAVLFPANDAYSLSGKSTEGIFTALDEKKLKLFFALPKTEEDLTALTASKGYFQVDFIIDEKLSKQAIADKLKQAEDVANAKGLTIIAGRPYPITIAQLNSWAEQSKDKFMFVKVSEILGTTPNAH